MSTSTGNVVAIDTSGSFCTVALRTAGGVTSSLSSPGSGDHFEQLPKMVSTICAQAGLSASSLSEIRIGVGPGSFTGLRIGMSFVKGLAWSLRIPLIGCSSFAGIAASAFERHKNVQRIVTIADARRDEVFAAVYERGAPVEERIAPCIVPASDCLSAPWAGDATVWATPQREFQVPGVALEIEPDGAKGLLSLPIGSFEGYKLEEIAVLEPTYLRAVAAKTIEERKLGT